MRPNQGPHDFTRSGRSIARVRLTFSHRLQAPNSPTIVPTPVALRGSTGWILFHLVIPFRFKEVVEHFARIRLIIPVRSVGRAKWSGVTRSLVRRMEFFRV